MTDERAAELAKLAQGGDADALQQLVVAHFPMASLVASDFRNGILKLDRSMEIEDVEAICHQELALVVVPRYDGRIPFRRWASVRLRARLLSEMRRRQRADMFLGAFAVAHTRTREDDADDAMLLEEQRRDLDALVGRAYEAGRLSLRAARLVYMRLAGRSDTDMVVALGAHKATVHRELRRAVAVLRDMAAGC